jgi:hypothetical protein
MAVSRFLPGECITLDERRLEALKSPGFRLCMALRPVKAWSGRLKRLYPAINFLELPPPPPPLYLILLETVIIILDYCE